MLTKDIGIDLGTCNTLIYIKKEGIVLNEPSVVVINEKNNDLVSIGKEAEKMLGKTPKNVKAIWPIQDGVIADFETAELMLSSFIKKVNNGKGIIKPKILISCPSSITEVEKNAIVELAEKIGAGKIYIEENSKLSAIGTGIDINKPCGNMIVDIGGGRTNIAVLSLGDIVISESIKIAGNKFNEDLINYIKKNYEVLIGDNTAEKIKSNFANCFNTNKEKMLTVKGRNLISGLPTTIKINQADTKKALEESINKIIEVIKHVLEETPPELSSDIVDKGLVLTGGGAILKGLREKLNKELSIPVLIAKSPLTSVIEGEEILLNNVKNLNRIA